MNIGQVGCDSRTEVSAGETRQQISADCYTATNQYGLDPLGFQPTLPFPAGKEVTFSTGWFCDDSNHSSRLFHAYDLAVPGGTPVLAVAEGTIEDADDHCVTDCNVGKPCSDGCNCGTCDTATNKCGVTGDATCNGNWGNYVIVKHSDGVYSKYTHLSYDSVPQWVTHGASVDAGTPIGKVGSTGTSSGPHLHFQFQSSPLRSPSGTPQTIPFAEGFVSREAPTGELTVVPNSLWPRRHSTNVTIGTYETVPANSSAAWRSPGSIQFLEKYTALRNNGCDIGQPFDNGGGKGVHTIDTVELQDLMNVATPRPACLVDSLDGASALVRNPQAVAQVNAPGSPAACPAGVYHIRNGFWGAYKCLANDMGTGMQGPALLGPPCSDEGPGLVDGVAVTVQHFRYGYMWWNGGGAIHVHFDREMDIGSLSAGCAALTVVENPPGPGNSCPPNDACLNMSCSSHVPPLDGFRFKTPDTGPGVFYSRGPYKHAFPSSICYHLFFDSFAGLHCIASQVASTLSDAPAACSEGSFVRRQSSSTVYRLESGRLRPLCGAWTEADFIAHTGYPFAAVMPIDDEHFELLVAQYPIATGGVYPPGILPPACGQPGFECGRHVDPETICYEVLDCSECTSCIDSPWGCDVSGDIDEPPAETCGNGTCAVTESCMTCQADCGACPVSCAADLGGIQSNGSFASGTNCWLGEDHDTPSATFAVDSSVFHTSAPSIRVENTIAEAPGQGFRVQLTQLDRPILAGHTYRVRYWARAAAPRTIVVSIIRGAAPYDDVGLWQVHSVGVDWQLSERTFVATQTLANGKLGFSVGESTITTWFDDISVEDLGVAPHVETCGNGTCAVTESCMTCQSDCGACPAETCGNGICAVTENCMTCQVDLRCLPR